MDNENFLMNLYVLGSSFKPDGYDCLRNNFLGNYRKQENHPAPGEETRVIFMVALEQEQKVR